MSIEQPNDGMAKAAINSETTPTPPDLDGKQIQENRYATFSAAIEQLKTAAVTLSDFGLEVKFKWRKPGSKYKDPNLIKFPEIPRCVTEDVAKMVGRYERKQEEAEWKYLPKKEPKQLSMLQLSRLEWEQKEALQRFQEAKQQRIQDKDDPEFALYNELTKAQLDHTPNYPPFLETTDET